ncbi:MAG: bifunctional adenosylcobinamide kinase/adenosylcobinamide-phosphate guanylyltransferase [Synergistaceae bacterium]|jgi:adenosylcobinamide kinase/adenosylcobinamide-phosphate guanylyltransferase|nr:bifunctional adenosylcobinamide kinase/adenosylcobinamide-phosphate guanylyltransferase [Synergistaceae bacterium]
MFVFVSGAARSGKSAWAEEYVLSKAFADACVPDARAPLVYLATARVCDQEMEKRVLHHQRARKNKGFETLERDVDISGIIPRLAPASTILLECLGTLLANEMFGRRENKSPTHSKLVGAKIYEELMLLRAKAENLVIVSNDIFSDGMVYDGETERYRRTLGALHVSLAGQADLAVECICGMAVQTYSSGANDPTEGRLKNKI